MKQRFIELDWIRGLSAIFIVLFHYTARFLAVYDTSADFAVQLKFGAGAVAVFFMLSAFLTTIRTTSEDKPLLYLCKRFFRLYPAFLTCLIITSLVTYFFLPSRFVGIKDLLLNLTMVPEVFGATAVDGVYWTLKYEIAFYLFVAVVLFTKKREHVKYFAFFWLVTATITSIAELKTDGDTLPLKILRFISFGNYSCYFIGGIMLGEMFLSEKKFAAFEAFGFISSVAYSFVFAFVPYAVFFAAAGATVLAVIFIRKSAKYGEGYVSSLEKVKKALNPLEFVSKISYPLYLIHQVAGYVVLLYVVQLGYNDEFIVFIPVFISVVLAYCIHRFIEKPVIRATDVWLNERFSKR